MEIVNVLRWVAFLSLLFGVPPLMWWWLRSGAYRAAWRIGGRAPAASMAPKDAWVVHPLATASVDLATADLTSSRPLASGRPLVFPGGRVVVHRSKASDGDEVRIEVSLDPAVAAYSVAVNGREL